MASYDKNRFTRRNVLCAGTATLGLGGLSGISATDQGLILDSESSIDSARQIPPAGMTDIASQLESVSPSEIVPDRKTGIGPGALIDHRSSRHGQSCRLYGKLRLARR